MLVQICPKLVRRNRNSYKMDLIHPQPCLIDVLKICQQKLQQISVYVVKAEYILLCCGYLGINKFTLNLPGISELLGCFLFFSAPVFDRVINTEVSLWRFIAIAPKIAGKQTSLK